MAFRMKMKDALKIMDKETEGFMVSFELKIDGMLYSDHFPEKHSGEDLIETEKDAWVLANEFANKMKGKAVNIYVVDNNFSPVHNYEDKRIRNR